jgi:hypothetical protein
MFVDRIGLDRKVPTDGQSKRCPAKRSDTQYLLSSRHVPAEAARCGSTGGSRDVDWDGSSLTGAKSRKTNFASCIKLIRLIQPSREK